MTSNRSLLAMGDEQDEERVLVVGAFDPAWVKYTLAVTCVGTFMIFFTWPLLLPLAYVAARAAFRSWQFKITEKHLSYRSGFYGCFCVCWNMEERLVPVSMITDVTYGQGWLQGLFGLEQLTIRTAGSMIGEGGRADISLVGLRNAREVRDLLLELIGKHGGQGGLGGGRQRIEIGLGEDTSMLQAYGTGGGWATALLQAVLRIERAVRSLEQQGKGRGRRQGGGGGDVEEGAGCEMAPLTASTGMHI